MARDKNATPEEIRQIKAYFERRGFGWIHDETAKMQVEVLRMIRAGTLPGIENGAG